MIPQVVSAQLRSLEEQHEEKTIEIFHKLVNYILQLSDIEPKSIDEIILILIQEVVDIKVGPEQFCYRLVELLNITLHPCLIVLIERNLPYLKQSLMLREMVIDGIRPPRH